MSVHRVLGTDDSRKLPLLRPIQLHRPVVAFQSYRMVVYDSGGEHGVLRDLLVSDLDMRPGHPAWEAPQGRVISRAQGCVRRSAQRCLGRL